jgi:hypothetical protein
MPISISWNSISWNTISWNSISWSFPFFWVTLVTIYTGNTIILINSSYVWGLINICYVWGLINICYVWGLINSSYVWVLINICYVWGLLGGYKKQARIWRPTSVWIISLLMSRKFKQLQNNYHLNCAAFPVCPALSDSAFFTLLITLHKFSRF